MSTVYSTYAGFVGIGDGKTAHLDLGDAYNLSDPVVQAHPALFTARAPGTTGTAPESPPEPPPAALAPAAAEPPPAAPAVLAGPPKRNTRPRRTAK